MNKTNKRIIIWIISCGAVYTLAIYLLVLSPIYSLVGSHPSDVDTKINSLDKRAKVVMYVGSPLFVMTTVGGIFMIKRNDT